MTSPKFSNAPAALSSLVTSYSFTSGAVSDVRYCWNMRMFWLFSFAFSSDSNLIKKCRNYLNWSSVSKISKIQFNFRKIRIYIIPVDVRSLSLIFSLLPCIHCSYWEKFKLKLPGITSYPQGCWHLVGLPLCCWRHNSHKWSPIERASSSESRQVMTQSTCAGGRS